MPALIVRAVLSSVKARALTVTVISAVLFWLSFTVTLVVPAALPSIRTLLPTIVAVALLLSATCRV